MSRPKSAPRPQRRGKPNTGGVRPAATAKPLDPNFEQRITRVVKQFMTRSLLISLGILIICDYLLSRERIPAKSLPPYIALATFAIVFPFVRGAARVFAQIKQAGIECCERRRYADAKFALEYFHRFGQMSFDPNGEAHYFLTRAYLGLDDYENAQKMLTWMQRNRRKFDWTQKAQEAVQTAEKTHQQKE